MSGVRIVPMSEEHLGALEKIDALCFSDPWPPEGLRAELSSDTACFAAAECGGETVGCAGMHCICGECYIDKVCVHPGFRRRGIARALVRYLIDAAVKNHAEFITLEVRRSNDDAVALYAGLGFEPVGVRKDFYTAPKEDALLMTRFFQNKG